jgi:Na+-translocating ferredoxin:NAD+ oxidoreductase RnfD subunit
MEFQKKLMSTNIYHDLIFFLSALTIYNVFVIGISKTLPQLLIALITVSLLDILINYIKSKRFIRPYHTIITALFIATILPTGQAWYVPAIISAIAILSKHLININKRHLFNPAMFGLFFSALLFNQSSQWWATSPLPVILIFGLFIAYKFRRLHLALSYIVTILLLGFILAPSTFSVASILNLNYFFIFFMLVEPMSSPIYKKGRILFGFLAAVLVFSFSTYITNFSPYILALLAANLFVPLINKYVRN